MHVHRFLWRDSPTDDIEDYAIVRVNMGDKPAGCIAQVAMRETAYLPQFNDKVEERHVIVDNAYVDDILVSHNDPQRLSEVLEGVEAILATGGVSPQAMGAIWPKLEARRRPHQIRDYCVAQSVAGRGQ